MQTATPSGLGATPALPGRVRRELKRDVVFFQIEEVNAVYDLLSARRSNPGLTEQSRQIARARVSRVLRATKMIRDVAVRNAWAYIERELDRPEDAFGPAVVLLGLAAGDPAVRRWMTTLPSEVRSALAQVGVTED